MAAQRLQRVWRPLDPLDPGGAAGRRRADVGVADEAQAADAAARGGVVGGVGRRDPREGVGDRLRPVGVVLAHANFNAGHDRAQPGEGVGRAVALALAAIRDPAAVPSPPKPPRPPPMCCGPPRGW